MAAGIALGVAGIAVAAIILLSSSSSSTSLRSSSADGSSYRAHLTSALAPLVSANQALSGALIALNGSRASVTSAQNAGSQAQSAVSAARGALTVLNAPAADSSLSQEAQQALSEDNGYVQAVVSTLHTPVGQSSSQLQTLATGAQTALVPLDSVVQGASASISGTSNLLSWAAGASGAAHAAAVKAAASGAQQGGSSAAAGAPSSVVPVAGGAAVSTTGALACGGGVMAGPHTSCPFAENVQQAWQAAPGQSAVVTAYSPVTGQSYTMSCGPDSAGGILCTGIGADNSVWW